MKQDEFRQAVKTRTDVETNDQADEIIQAVVSTLGERITGGEAEDLAAQLPQPYKTYVSREGGIEAFGVEEYFDRVAGKLRVGRGVATRYAQAVMAVLNEAVTPGELGDVFSQLPEEYTALFKAPLA